MRVLRRVARQESGVTLMEMVVAMGLFATVTTPIAGVLTASMSSHRASQERTLAEQAALAQIESIRALPYDAVGVVDGNPPGSVLPSRPVSAAGISATIATQVAFVNDPTRTSYVTAADYKKVVVTVTSARGKRLTQAATYVAPPGRAAYGGMSGTIIRAQVVDMALNTAVGGAGIALSGGPSAPRSDIADGNGTVTFAGLTSNPTSGPSAFYDVHVTANGYQVLKDDLPPSTSAHVQLAPGQSFNTVLRVYRPATLTVLLNDAAGAPYGGPATIVVGSSRAAEAFPVTSGQVTITSLGGEPLVPGLSYTVAAYAQAGLWAPSTARAVPNAYPTDLTSTFALALGATAPSTSTLTVRVETAAGVAVAGARIDLSGGPATTFLTAVSDAAGNATFTAPAGTGYTATVTGPSRSGTGTWSGPVSAPTTATVRLS